MPNGHILRKVTVVPTLLVALVAFSIPPGCTTAVPGAPISTGVPVASPRTVLAQDAQNVALIQADLNDLELLGEGESGFATLAGPGARRVKPVALSSDVQAAAGALNADKKQQVRARRAAMQAKAADRLKDAAGKLKQGMVKEVADNDLGGQTVTFTFSFTHKNGAKRTATMERVYNAEKVLVSAKQVQDRVAPNGNTRHMERTKELQADGSYKVTGTATLTVDGKTQSHTWTKVIAADGSVTGTGTFTKADGTTKTVTFGGTEEKETSTVADAATGTVATVEASAETGADTAATVTEGATGTKVEVPVATEATVSSDIAEAVAPTAT